jgi:endonuclease/exonuclease/phosphatase family metal-dependent hydrolase
MYLRKLTAVAVLLFFLQALRVLFSTLFGIIYDQIFEGPLTSWLALSGALVFLGLLAPPLLARRGRTRLRPILAVLAVAARPLLTINDATVRYAGALIVAAAGAGYLASLLGDRVDSWRALIWAILAEQVLRALGDTFDLSLMDAFLPVQIAVSLALIYLILREAAHEPQETQAGIALPWLTALGAGAFLFLETSLLALPSAIARWASVPYAPLALLVMAATSAPFLLRTATLRSAGARAGLGVLLLGGVILGYALNGWLAGLALIMAQASACLGLRYILFERRESGTSASLSGGMLLFLLLNFANAFAFTYPYTLPAMRGMGWLVYGFACLALAVPVVLRSAPVRETPVGGALARTTTAGLAGALLLAVWAVRPLEAAPLPQGKTLRLATWNIHYGYDDPWHTTLPEIEQAIGQAGVDAIALQEVDAGRMTSYSADDAYFLGRRLGMQVAYLPTIEHLTGIALLYKGDPARVETMLLPSLQEQTGIVRVQLPTAGGELQAHAIWLGLSAEDTLAQIDAALDFIGPGTRASFGGDFNSEFDDPEVSRVLAAGFADPFQLLGLDPAPLTDPAISPDKRIDFVFVRDLVPVEAWVADSLASDHRMVVVEVAVE